MPSIFLPLQRRIRINFEADDIIAADRGLNQRCPENKFFHFPRLQQPGLFFSENNGYGRLGPVACGPGFVGTRAGVDMGGKGPGGLYGRLFGL